MAKYTRLLTFYYSPKKPQTIYFTVNKAKQAELSWEAAEGISNWIVTEKVQKLKLTKLTSHIL